MSSIFIVLGCLLLVVGIYLKMNEGKDEPKADSGVSTEVSEESLPDESKEKGDAFEKWVVSHFNKKVFKLTEWRSDKYHQGRYAESNTYPDLELELMKEEGITFAVECKYRSEFKDGSIKWADENNIENYNRFSNDKGIPVIIVIGVGGSADSPEKVYCVKLESLKYPIATEQYLSNFLRENTQANFFFDVKEKKLR